MNSAASIRPADFSEPMAAALRERPVLNFWIFAVPYLASIIYFFMMIKEDTRIYAPVFPIVVVLAAATLITIVDRRLPQLNHDVLFFALVYVGIGALSVLISQNNDSFALRKIALPLVGMAPAIFRFYITPRQMLVFLIVLFAVALIYTTQTPDAIASDFFSTDSPYESILGATFGALTVWLVASSRPLLAALSYLACILFFKRNAMMAALVVSVILVAVQFWWRRDSGRILRNILYVAFPLLAALALYLSEIFDFVSSNLIRGYDAEYISVGRAPIYDFIIADFERSTVREQLLGHGAGTVEYMITSERSINAGLQLAHDEYLSWLYDFGVVGLLALMFCLARISRSGTAAVAVILYMVIAMSAENFFLISFNCLAVFALFSTRMVDTGRGAQPGP